MFHGPWYMVNQKWFHGVFYQHHALESTKLENFNLEKILIHLGGKEMNPTLFKMTFGSGLVTAQELARERVGLILQWKWL